MSKEVGLFIIYNHRYDANIEKLEKIYGCRFSNIYHIMPFYNGDKENVIPVYECSFRFQGYVTQAIQLIQKRFDQYFFIADDLILNPAINETNYQEWFHLNGKNAFITFTKPLREMGGWAINRRFMDPLPKFEWYSGTLWEKEIMPSEQAYDIAKQKGYDKTQFLVDIPMIWGARKKLKQYPRLIVLFFKILLLGKQQCPYPVFGGYSDIFIIPGEKIKEVSHMLGVFAAMGLFVEMAIPTALQLLCESVTEVKDLSSAYGKSLWSITDKQSVNTQYNYQYKTLEDNWDKDCLYIHPVKLSKWDV
ncbi:MAG: hypothetical protein K2P65_06490 [Lachnospiraceae bacterium]|nr:hypothetical protein [Lachnospiraceae bacterium]